MTQDIRKYNVITDYNGEGLIGYKDNLIDLYKSYLKEDFDMFSIDGIFELAELLKELDLQPNNALICVSYPYNCYKIKVIYKEDE